MAVGLCASARADETRASSDGRFSFTIADCPSLSGAEIRRLLTIEIGDLLLPESTGVLAHHDRLTVQCVDQLARVQAAGLATPAPFEQVVNLRDLPGDAAPRALALAGLELLASLNSFVRARIEANTPAPREPPAPPAPAAHDLRLGVAGVGRAFLTNEGALLWGGRADALWLGTRRWALAFDLELAHGRKSVADLGRATAWSLTSAIAVALHGRSGFLEGTVGVGGRFGMMWLAGASAQPATVSDASVAHPWGGPLALLGGAAHLGRLSLCLRAEIGQALLGTQGSADGATVLATAGTWLALSLGGGFSP